MTNAIDRTIDLSAQLTVRTIAGAKETLLEVINSSDSLSLRVSPDSDLDIAGIQLIFAARIYARGASKKLSLAAPLAGRALAAMERCGFLTDMSVEDRRFWLQKGI